MFLQYTSSCFILLSLRVAPGDLTAAESSASKRRVVVFDVDDALCKPDINSEEVEHVKTYYPECPIIIWEEYKTLHPHAFIPYLEILFNYLLEKGVRVVFFSAAIETRDKVVIPDLLKSFWGSEKFEALVAKGQFDIFSRSSMRRSNESIQERGCAKKDLKKVLRDGESLSDVVLVEDDPSYTAHDQEPCLQLLSLTNWELYVREWKENFPLNMVYYMLGVFQTYFDNEKYEKLPLREGLKQILPADGVHFFKDEFAKKTIEKGLAFVHKFRPNATLYVTRFAA